jgi:hypothetical protein
MEIGARRAYLAAVKERYRKSSKKQKTQRLNEFCSNCNYNRKHAIKLLSKTSGPWPYTKRVGAPRKYPDAVSRKLVELWAIMGNPCSTTLKVALPHWPPCKHNFHEALMRSLLTIGPSTIEWHLRL